MSSIVLSGESSLQPQAGDFSLFTELSRDMICTCSHRLPTVATAMKQRVDIVSKLKTSKSPIGGFKLVA